MVWLIPITIILGAWPGRVDGSRPDYAELFESGRVLKVGQTGEDVRQLQALLRDLGLYTASVDGIFGEKTKAAVLAFQQSYGLLRDGIVGPGTKQALPARQAHGFSRGDLVDYRRQVWLERFPACKAQQPQGSRPLVSRRCLGAPGGRNHTGFGEWERVKSPA